MQFGKTQTRSSQKQNKIKEIITWEGTENKLPRQSLGRAQVEKCKLHAKEKQIMYDQTI